MSSNSSDIGFASALGLGLGVYSFFNGFLSWRNEKELKSALRKRAAFRIFGGGAISVACLGILLAKLGWL